MRSTDTDVSDTFAGSDGNWTVTITGAADETGRAVAWSCCVSGTPPTEPLVHAERCRYETRGQADVAEPTLKPCTYDAFMNESPQN